MDYNHIKGFFSKGQKKGEKTTSNKSSGDFPRPTSQERPFSASELTSAPYTEAVQGTLPKRGSLPIHGKHGAYTAPRRHRQGFTIGTQGSALGDSSSPITTSPQSLAIRHNKEIPNPKANLSENYSNQMQDTWYNPNQIQPENIESTERSESTVLRLENPRVAPPQPPTTPMDVLSDPLRDKLVLDSQSPSADDSQMHSTMGEFGTSSKRPEDGSSPESATKSRHFGHHHHPHHHHHGHHESEQRRHDLTNTNASEQGPGKAASENMIKLHHHEDTTVKTHYAPPVYHETIKPHVHHIREEHIHREIHNHDVYHRVLPIIDVKVLPTKHYTYDNAGQLVEIIDPSAGSSKGHLNKNWVIAETVAQQHPGKLHSKYGTVYDGDSYSPRQFTARTFGGSEGDEKVYLRDDGVAVTETTWVHHPTLEDGGRRTGQTVPMVFRHVDAKSPDASRQNPQKQPSRYYRKD